MFLQMRAVVKGDVEVTSDMCEVWHDEMIQLDKLFRDRLFILTIAAEGGWRIASEVAFRKKVHIRAAVARFCRYRCLLARLLIVVSYDRRT